MNTVPLSPSVRAKVQKYVKDGNLPLSSGSIKGLLEQKSLLEPVILQLVKFKFEDSVPGTCSRAALFDGSHSYKYFYFADGLADQLKMEKLVGKTTEQGEGGEFLMISEARFLGENASSGSPLFVIHEFSLLAKGIPLMDGAGIQHNGTEEAIAMFRDLLRDVPGNSCSIPFDAGDANSSSSNPPIATSSPRNSARSSNDVTPIAAVFPYVARQRIRGVCLTTEYRNTANGDKIFIFVLMDEHHTSIRVVGFGDGAAKAHDLVNENQVYYLSGGKVKTADKKYNTTGHEFEITLSRDTDIELCSDFVITPPPLVFNPCPLNKLFEHKDESVDVLAIIDEMEDVTDFTSRAGKDLTKRDLYLIDSTGVVVQFTLWNQHARQFEEGSRGKAIGIKGAFVKLWTGGYSLSAISGTKWELCPNHPEVPRLYRWYNFKRQLSQSSQASTIEGGVLVRDLLSSQDSQGLDERETKVTANITSIQNTTFQSCTNDDCQKKVLPVDNSFYCEQCDKTTDTFKWRKSIILELTDCSGSVYAKALEDIAEKLFGSSSTQGEPLDSDNRVMNEEGCKKYLFTLFPVPTVDNEATNVRYQILDVKEVNLENYFMELEKTVEQTFR